MLGRGLSSPHALTGILPLSVNEVLLEHNVFIPLHGVCGSSAIATL